MARILTGGQDSCCPLDTPTATTCFDAHSAASRTAMTPLPRSQPLVAVTSNLDTRRARGNQARH